MTQTKLQFKTMAEYIAATPSELPEGNFELVNGEIIPLPPESDPNIEIAGFLVSALLQFVPHYLIRRGTEILVSSRTVSSRFPDLLILTEEGRAVLKGAKRSTITPDMPSPALVVEIVSPGDPDRENYSRDYVEKPQEYAARDIPEFWQIDSGRGVITVQCLRDGEYQPNEFCRKDWVVSPRLPDLQLTAEQILNAGD